MSYGRTFPGVTLIHGRGSTSDHPAPELQVDLEAGLAAQFSYDGLLAFVESFASRRYVTAKFVRIVATCFIGR